MLNDLYLKTRRIESEPIFNGSEELPFERSLAFPSNEEIAKPGGLSCQFLFRGLQNDAASPASMAALAHQLQAAVFAPASEFENVPSHSIPFRLAAMDANSASELDELRSADGIQIDLFASHVSATRTLREPMISLDCQTQAGIISKIGGLRDLMDSPVPIGVGICFGSLTESFLADIAAHIDFLMFYRAGLRNGIIGSEEIAEIVQARRCLGDSRPMILMIDPGMIDRTELARHLVVLERLGVSHFAIDSLLPARVAAENKPSETLGLGAGLLGPVTDIRKEEKQIGLLVALVQQWNHEMRSIRKICQCPEKGKTGLETIAGRTLEATEFLDRIANEA